MSFKTYRDQCKFYNKAVNGCTDTTNPVRHLPLNGCKECICTHRPFVVVESPVFVGFDLTALKGG